MAHEMLGDDGRFKGRNYLFAALGASNVGAGLFLPVAFLFFTANSNLSASEVGFALTLAALCALPIAIPAGALADRYDPRFLLLLNILGNAAGYCFYLVANTYGLIIFAVFTVMSIDRLYYSAWSVLTSRITGGNNLDQWVSTTEILTNASMGFGSLIGTAIAIKYGSTATVFTLLLCANILSLAIAAIFFLLFIFHTSDRPDKDGHVRKRQERLFQGAPGDSSWYEIIGDRHLLNFMMAQVLIAFGWTLPTIVFPLYFLRVMDMPVSFITFMFSIHWILQIFIQNRITKLASTFDRSTTILFSATLLIASLISIYAGKDGGDIVRYASSLFSILLASIATMAYVPAANSLVLLAVSDQLRGRAGSAFQLAVGTAAAVGPALVGVLFDLGQQYLIFSLVALIGGGALLTTYSCDGLPKKAKGRPASR